MKTLTRRIDVQADLSLRREGAKPKLTASLESFLSVLYKFSTIFVCCLSKDAIVLFANDTK